jgi:hypothetical protein
MEIGHNGNGNIEVGTLHDSLVTLTNVDSNPVQ